MSDKQQELYQGLETAISELVIFYYEQSVKNNIKPDMAKDVAAGRVIRQSKGLVISEVNKMQNVGGL